MSEPALSIVIIGRNEGQRLSRCLESVVNSIVQNPTGMLGQVSAPGEEAEIFYVDSGSRDGSPDLARRFGAQVIVLDAAHPTAALGRNAGWQRARAEFVLFLDGDTILHPDFLQKACAALAKDGAIAAVWGHRREIHPERSIYNRVLDLDWVYQPGETQFCGGDVLMRRAALMEAGGYDPALIAGEEPELCRRLRALGYRILHIDCPMTGHDLEMTSWSQYWKHALRAGHAYAEVSHRYRGSADPTWAAESKANFVRGGFWVASFSVALIALVRTPLPLAAWLAVALLASIRSAWKSRWKAPGSPALLLLYGIHSHLQQVPILAGQLGYLRDRRAGKRRELIEYKERA